MNLKYASFPPTTFDRHVPFGFAIIRKIKKIRQRKQVGLGADACAYRRPIMLESKSYAPAKKENDTHLLLHYSTTDNRSWIPSVQKVPRITHSLHDSGSPCRLELQFFIAVGAENWLMLEVIS